MATDERNIADEKVSKKKHDDTTGNGNIPEKRFKRAKQADLTEYVLEFRMSQKM